MDNVTAKYTSPTHSLNVTQAVDAEDDSHKASLHALHRAILTTQTELNVFLTERKHEEDRANGIDATSKKRKKGEDGEENDEENEAIDEEEEN